MLSASLERYLLCIHTFSKENKELKSSDIAKQMKEPLQKVVQALQRMHYQKYIIYSPYQALKLTDRGKDLAHYLLARDALLEEFLTILQLKDEQGIQKEAMGQYLSYDNLKMIEKFILFHREYPEMGERYKLLLKMPPTYELLPPLPTYEKRS